MNHPKQENVHRESVKICSVCGILLIKQEIGEDGLPVKEQNTSEYIPGSRQEMFTKKTYLRIWSCPVHGVK